MNRSECVKQLLDNENILAGLYTELAGNKTAKERFAFDTFTSCQAKTLKEKEFAVSGACMDLTTQINDLEYQIKTIESLQHTLRVILTHGLED